MFKLALLADIFSNTSKNTLDSTENRQLRDSDVCWSLEPDTRTLTPVLLQCTIILAAETIIQDHVNSHC